MHVKHVVKFCVIVTHIFRVSNFFDTYDDFLIFDKPDNGFSEQLRSSERSSEVKGRLKRPAPDGPAVVRMQGGRSAGTSSPPCRGGNTREVPYRRRARQGLLWRYLSGQ